MTFTFEDFKARFFPAAALAGRAASESPAPVALQDNPVPNGLDRRRGGARAAHVPDHIDGIPIAAILAAIKADPAALHRRREVLEGEIRSVWATLQELVREYRALSDDAMLPQGVTPTLATKMAGGPLPKEMAEALGSAIGLPLTVMPNALRAPTPAPEIAAVGAKDSLFDVDEDEPAAKAEPVRLPRSRTMVRPARRQAR
ncbi:MULTISPECIES: hypothetical protein [Nitrospirillum]|uniref:Uncharacterized protein n=1 Tax=Nitrospirillum amazonense TaxID=28077 RepID=A0A560FRH4_9PROT|nr:hypothetical protein [Nitrospirillum amazonense]MEC4591515.1 hypothetical protein [Nitrospirillum amazonense]TWB24238.1 hypothetical protein FBZ88_11290 [Nitrospirillum amazonense]